TLVDCRHHRVLPETGADFGRFQQAGIHELVLLGTEALDQDGDVGLPVRVLDRARIQSLQVGRVLHHLGTERFEQLDRILYRDRDIAIDFVALDEAQRWRIGDGQTLYALVEALEVVVLIVGTAVGITRVGPGHDVHHHGGVAHRARHRPDVGERALRRRRPQRHARLSGLQPEQAGKGAGNAHRARAV